MAKPSEEMKKLEDKVMDLKKKVENSAGEQKEKYQKELKQLEDKIEKIKGIGKETIEDLKEKGERFKNL